MSSSSKKRLLDVLEAAGSFVDQLPESVIKDQINGRIGVAENIVQEGQKEGLAEKYLDFERGDIEIIKRVGTVVKEVKNAIETFRAFKLGGPTLEIDLEFFRSQMFDWETQLADALSNLRTLGAREEREIDEFYELIAGFD